MTSKPRDYSDIPDENLRKLVAAKAGFSVVVNGRGYSVNHPGNVTGHVVYKSFTLATQSYTDLFRDMGYVWRLFDLTNGSLTMRSDGNLIEVTYADRRYGLNVINATAYTPERALMAAWLAYMESKDDDHPEHT